MEAIVVDHRQPYRMPWTLPDDPISWLEPTSMQPFLRRMLQGKYDSLPQAP